MPGSSLHQTHLEYPIPLPKFTNFLRVYHYYPHLIRKQNLNFNIYSNYFDPHSDTTTVKFKHTSQLGAVI